MVIRYLFPALALFALLGGIALTQIQNKYTLIFKAILIITLFNIGSNCQYLYSVIGDLRELEHRGALFYAIEKANSTLKNDKQLLMVGETRTYGLVCNYISPSIFDTNYLEEVIINNRDTKKIKTAMVNNKISHILFFPEGLHWQQKSFNYFVHYSSYLRLMEFLSSKEVKKTYSNELYIIYEVQ